MNPDNKLVTLIQKASGGIIMKKSKFTHSTRRCPFDDLQSEFRQAMRDFIVGKKLGDMERMSMHCYETTTGFSSWPWGTLERYTDLVLTQDWFFWGLSGSQVDTSEGCARIRDLRGTVDFEHMPAPDTLEVHGINISGFTYDETRIESWLLRIAADEAGKEFLGRLSDVLGRFSREPPKARYRHG